MTQRNMCACGVVHWITVIYKPQSQYKIFVDTLGEISLKANISIIAFLLSKKIANGKIILFCNFLIEKSPSL